MTVSVRWLTRYWLDNRVYGPAKSTGIGFSWTVKCWSDQHLVGYLVYMVADAAVLAQHKYKVASIRHFRRPVYPLSDHPYCRRESLAKESLLAAGQTVSIIRVHTGFYWGREQLITLYKVSFRYLR